MNSTLNDVFTSYAVLSLALILDAIYPYHKGILLKTHPVHTSFFLGKRLIKPYASRLYGFLLWLIVVSAHILPLALIQVFLLYYWSSNPIIYLIYVLFFSYVLKVSFSLRLLISTGLRVLEKSLKGEWIVVREVVQGLVRRNVSALNKGEVLSACIESLAESLVDGFVSPLFYFPFFGPLGSLLQRIVNTLDGLVGFKISELVDIGWFSAKADTVINYLPARLTAFYIVFSSFLLHLDWRSSLKTWLRDRRKTESVNAGNPMSAMAGALKVKLVKLTFYELGNQEWNLPEPRHVAQAIKILEVSATIHLLLVIALLLALIQLP